MLDFIDGFRIVLHPDVSWYDLAFLSDTRDCRIWKQS